MQIRIGVVMVRPAMKKSSKFFIRFETYQPIASMKARYAAMTARSNHDMWALIWRSTGPPGRMNRAILPQS